MAMFWISAAAMAAMVALVLSVALKRGGAEEGGEDAAIYRDQLAEIGRDQARGILTEEEAGRLKLEVSRRLLEADRRVEAGGRALPGTFGALAILAVVVAAVGLYRGVGPVEGLGAPGYDDLPLVRRLADAQAVYDSRPSQDQAEAARPAWVAPQGTDAQTLELMDKLRSAVAGRPDDLKGQELLVENEVKLGNFVSARKAQERVVAILGDKAGAGDWLRAAELKIYATGGLVTPQAEADLGQVLAREPQNGAARFWIGLMAAQVGRPDRAFQMWAPLIDEGPEDAPWIAPIRNEIEAVAAAAGVPYTLPQTGGPSASDVAGAAAMTPEARQKMIEGMVGGLESRLMSEGGPVEDWVKLINALGVLQASDRARTAYAAASKAFASEPGALSALKAAAAQAGVAE